MGTRLATFVVIAVGFMLLGPFCGANSQATLESLNTLIATGLIFILGPYVGLAVGRWWSVRTNGVGALWGAVDDLSVWSAAWFHKGTLADHAARALVLQARGERLEPQRERRVALALLGVARRRRRERRRGRARALGAAASARAPAAPAAAVVRARVRALAVVRVGGVRRARRAPAAAARRGRAVAEQRGAAVDVTVDVAVVVGVDRLVGRAARAHRRDAPERKQAVVLGHREVRARRRPARRRERGAAARARPRAGAARAVVVVVRARHRAERAALGGRGREAARRARRGRLVAAGAADRRGQHAAAERAERRIIARRERPPPL